MKCLNAAGDVQNPSNSNMGQQYKRQLSKSVEHLSCLHGVHRQVFILFGKCNFIVNASTTSHNFYVIGPSYPEKAEKMLNLS